MNRILDVSLQTNQCTHKKIDFRSKLIRLNNIIYSERFIKTNFQYLKGKVIYNYISKIMNAKIFINVRG